MVQKWGVMNKAKDGQECPLFTHNFYLYFCIIVCMCVHGGKKHETSVLDLISQATDIQSKQLKKIHNSLKVIES